MSANAKRVFYVKYLSSPIFAELLQARGDVRLDRLENDSPSRRPRRSSRARTPTRSARRATSSPASTMSTSDLLRRAPNLLIVSSNGAGYDTVDVKACTRAGVLVSTRPAATAQSVAEHVLGDAADACPSASARPTARMRARGRLNRNAYIGTEAYGKTIGIVGLGHVGGARGRAVRGLFGMRVLAYDPYLSAEEIARARRREGRPRHAASPAPTTCRSTAR